MTVSIIITCCVLVLVAYLFDLTSSKTKIPSVILLLLLGWILRQLTGLLNIHVPDLSALLPVLGTVGLILIVLEGSLELELNRSKLPVIRKSFFVSFFPILVFSFGLAWAMQLATGAGLRQCLVNAIPLAVISSAIAIPSAANLRSQDKEFVIYESSLSDIIGVIFFNFIALNATIDGTAFLHFGMEMVLILLVSFVATAGLALLLSRINHHIKFIPIMVLVVLIYVISKVYHLPSLLFIMLFGLFLGNLDELRRFPWIKILKPELLNTEVHKFREISTEAAFLIRTFFFILFGYFIETAELLNLDSLLWAVGIVLGIFLIRGLQLKLSGLKLFPLLFIAPRGLITILLFLSIMPEDTMPLMNRSLVIQVIILTAIIMMLGMFGVKKEPAKSD